MTIQPYQTTATLMTFVCQEPMSESNTVPLTVHNMSYIGMDKGKRQGQGQGQEKGQEEEQHQEQEQEQSPLLSPGGSYLSPDCPKKEAWDTDSLNRCNYKKDFFLILSCGISQLTNSRFSNSPQSSY